ncbi:15003_t:CDS:2, partial [Racocetra persica]
RKILVKALIDTTSKSNTISKRLYNKLEEDYGLEDSTEVIDFQIRKNLSFDLVLGRDWLWMREAKISFGYSPKTCVHHAKIVIDKIDKPDLNLEKFVDMFKKLSIETNLSSSDSESTGSDWYDLDLKKTQKKRIHITKKNVISSSQKHRRNKTIRT